MMTETGEEYTDSECEMLLCLRYGSMHNAALAYLSIRIDKGELDHFTEQETKLIRPYIIDAADEKIKPILDKLDSWRNSNR